jgi:hypothetical protein
MSDWLGPETDGSGTPLRPLLWLADVPASWRLPESWFHPEARYEAVLAPGGALPDWLPADTPVHRVSPGGDLRKTIVAIDESAALPLDLIVTPAFAHPGHYMEGEALGEATTPVSIDLSKRTAQAWQVANAVTGSYGSAQLIYATAGLRVRGTATKGGQTVRFDTGTLVPTKPLEGLKFEREMDTSAGTVRVQLDLGVMLSRVDFSQPGATAGADGVVLLAPTSVAFNGFDRGVLDTGSYIISWQSN